MGTVYPGGQEASVSASSRLVKSEGPMFRKKVWKRRSE